MSGRKSPLRVGVAGLGTVGSQVVRQLMSPSVQSAQSLMALRAVSARDRGKERGLDFSATSVEWPVEWFDDALALAADDGLDVIVELIGGSDGPARSLVEAALKNGKHVVTANKALLAHHGRHLAELAEDAGVSLNYEAAVAGGVPVIRALREGLAGERILSVRGILNGTCNYILTEMEKSGRAYDEVLADAQRLGYAEADPSLDVNGTDAAHKLSILASLSFGGEVAFGDVYCEGIERITPADIRFAADFGYRIKLLAMAALGEAGLEQRVHPALVPLESPLAAVSGTVNAVILEGETAGPVVLEGFGAGGAPTASAIMADLLDVARGNICYPFRVPVGDLATHPAADLGGRKGIFYLRVSAADRPGSMAEITRELADAGVSIRQALQTAESAGGGHVPVVLLTHQTSEAAMGRALAGLRAHEDAVSSPLMLRVSEFASPA